jgi:hypothetical protein
MKKETQQSQGNTGNHGGGVFAWGGKVCEKAQMATKRSLCQKKTVGELKKRTCNPVEQEENRKNAYAGRGQETIWEMSNKCLK